VKHIRFCQFLGAAGLLTLAAGARATVLELATMDSLVSRSDLIVEGKVKSVESVLSGGHIETTIHVNVSQRYKGTLLSNDLELRQLGGAIQKPLPLAQAVPGMPVFKSDERVVLFLSTRMPKMSAESRQKLLAENNGEMPALLKSPKVIGGYQGKFTVFVDPTTKKSMVSRQSLREIQGVKDGQVSAEIRARMENSVKVTAADPLKARENKVMSVKSVTPSSAVAYDEFISNIQIALKKEMAAKKQQAASSGESASQDSAPAAEANPPAAEASSESAK